MRISSELITPNTWRQAVPIAPNALGATLRYMGLRERLVEVMDSIGNDAELARKAGVSRAAVSDWRSGKIKSLKAITVVNIQERTGYSARWLILGVGTKKVGQKSNSSELGALSHQSAQKLSKANEQKLLAVLRAFFDTDDEGKAQIAHAAEALTESGGSPRRVGQHSAKRGGGSARQ